MEGRKNSKEMERKSDFLARCEREIKWNLKVAEALPLVLDCALYWGKKAVNKHFADYTSEMLAPLDAVLTVEKDDFSGKVRLRLRDSKDCGTTKVIYEVDYRRSYVDENRHFNLIALGQAVETHTKACQADAVEYRRAIDEFDAWHARRQDLLKKHERMEAEMPHPLRHTGDRLETKFYID